MKLFGFFWSFERCNLSLYVWLGQCIRALEENSVLHHNDIILTYSNSEIKLNLELLLYFIYFFKKFTVKLKVKSKTSKKFKKGISFVFTLVDLHCFTIQ